jgi:hypothetical protein
VEQEGATASALERVDDRLSSAQFGHKRVGHATTGGESGRDGRSPSPRSPGEGWRRVQEVLEAPRAHEQHLSVGGHDGNAGLASPAFQQAQFAEDVALAQLADKPALGPTARWPDRRM